MENRILIPNHRQLDWYKRKTAFIHFTVNTFTGNEWGDGTESPEIFNPTELDCEQWMKALVDGGFTHAIFTAKHHDGFCLWPSKYTEHSVKNSPYKNGKGDVVREFIDACHKYGIKPGLYLSPWDRNFKGWGTDKYNDYYAAQLTELMTNYGPIYECWWDGAGSTEACYDWERWVNIIRENQKDCVIFGSLGATDYVDVRWIGNELGKAADNCYATIDASSLQTETTRELFRGKKEGNRFIPAECDVSIRPGWFYHEEQNALVKSPTQLINYWFESVGKNCGILLNIPPDKRGLICDKDAESIKLWNDAINNIFKDNLLDESIDLNALDKEFTLEYKLVSPQKINCIRLEEDIAFGQRINDFTVETLIENEWKLLCNGKVMGNCFARRFDTVIADAVKITAKADAKPVLKFVGAFYADESYFKESFENDADALDLTTMPSAKIINNKTEIEIEFGGIFPFNTVVFEGESFPFFEIFAFNGSQYESVYYGIQSSEHEVCKFKMVEGSYKIKLVAYECDGFKKDAKISVFLTGDK